MALWSEGVTNTNTQLQVFFSLHSKLCKSYGDTGGENACLKQKVKRHIQAHCLHFLSFPHLPSSPFERAAGTTSFPAPLASKLGSPTPLPHPELIPF